MTKEKEVTLEIWQADSADTALVLDFLNRVGKESDYMTLMKRFYQELRRLLLSLLFLMIKGR